MLHPRLRNSTNRRRLADCGRRPGPFFTRREDNTTPNDHGKCCDRQYPSWLKLVRTSTAGGDGFEGLAEVVGEGVGGGDGLSSGLDLDGAVAAGGLDEFPY